MPELSVQQFLTDLQSDLHLILLNEGVSLDRQIKDKSLHRPGLALAGFLDLFTWDRIQIMGNTENTYLRSLHTKQREKALLSVFCFQLPCIIISDSNAIPDSLLGLATQAKIPVFHTDLDTTTIYRLLSDYLDDIFAPISKIHATLVDVYGTGMLLTGKSGIGKSEVALDLVERGHRLVADDVVTVSRKASNLLLGTGNNVLEHLMEIRGMGIIDIRQIFGISAIRLQKRIEMVVELDLWEERNNFERTGLDQKTTEIMGVELPLIRLPIFPGKNITVLCETLALDLHLKVYGYDAAKEFNQRLKDSMRKKSNIQSYLRKDQE
jgi:HPr kinase/phosphorylase